MKQVPKGLKLPEPENIPGELWQLMNSCWDLQPEKRPDFAKVCRKLTMNDCLKQILEKLKEIKRAITKHDHGQIAKDITFTQETPQYTEVSETSAASIYT